MNQPPQQTVISPQPAQVVWQLVCASLVALISTAGFAAEDDLVITQSDQMQIDRPFDFSNVQLDSLVFGAVVNDGHNDDYRAQIDALIQRKISELAVKYDLKQEKRDRLHLAAQADKSRFERDLNALRQQIDEMPKTRSNYLAMRQGALKLRVQFRSFLRPESFFAKAANAIFADLPQANWQTLLDDELQNGPFPTRPQVYINLRSVVRQQPVVAKDAGAKLKDEKEQLVIRHRANIESAMQTVDRLADLSNLQRQQLIELLLRELEPPKSTENYALLVVKYRFSRLPEKKLKPLFREDQWPKVLRAIELFRKAEPILINHRLVDAEVILPILPADAVTPVNRGGN